MALAIFVIFVFVTGASVGSFLNVSIARLPLEKSLLWPNSRCGACLQSIHWYDNLPLISYFILRGRCRTCRQHYSITYFLVELGTALGFVALFWLEAVQNVHGWPGHGAFSRLGNIPGTSWFGFAWHALLFSFLIVASVCDLRSREIPLHLTLTGTAIGLIGSVLMPWPWPQSLDGINTNPALPLRQGVYPWPVWLPIPAWCDGPGTWQTGLATGLIGALVGTFLLRAIGFLFSKGLGKEALGLGDADLMMMAGSFLGWQIVVVAFFLSVFPALLFGIIQLVVRKDNSLPFGPSLSLSVMATCLAWQPIGNAARPYLFAGEMLIYAAVGGAGLLFVMAFLLKLMRRPEEPQP
ncbi:MAG: prepilin peptidase [Gemmataceae bacterium]|nr:prepilin peptidase [Gemmataceae bacterium]